jgi:hypothetical protein
MHEDDRYTTALLDVVQFHVAYAHDLYLRGWRRAGRTREINAAPKAETGHEKSGARVGETFHMVLLEHAASATDILCPRQRAGPPRDG